MLNYKVLPLGDYEANCVILWGADKQALVIDPGADAKQLLHFLVEQGLSLGAIALTHGHCDHLSALDEVLAKYAVPVYMTEADAAWAFTKINVIGGYATVQQKPATLKVIQPHEVISVGACAAKVIPTPGHTRGGVVYYFEADKLLVTGDTLFAGSVGRTDLFSGSWDDLKQSLATLMTLPDDLLIIPGHGCTTRLGSEKLYNPYLAQL